MKSMLTYGIDLISYTHPALPARWDPLPQPALWSQLPLLIVEIVVYGMDLAPELHFPKTLPQNIFVSHSTALSRALLSMVHGAAVPRILA